MAYISCLHRPGSTRVALKLALIDPDSECLVIGRANRLEVYSAQPGENSLQLISTQTIYGNISALEKLRPASATTDHLFVLTDRSMHFTLHWDHAAKSLRTQTSVVDLSEFAQRDSLHEDRCHIDPASRFMSLEIHEGVIHVLPIARESKRVKLTAEPGTLGSATATRIPELGVKSSCFLHKRNAKDKPQLALLHTDASERTQIAVRELTFVYGNKDQPDNASFEDDPVQIVTGQVELGASHLISLAAPVYGFLVVGETSISYCDQWHFKLRTDPLPEATIFVAWTQIDEFRYLLADDYARLWILMIETNHKNDYDGFQIEIIGETARASTLVYLNDGIVFLGSHNSDSQLLRIGDRSVEILQTFSNLAPIIDFTIMDMGNRSSEAQVNEYSSGQARLVTGSGAYSDGSLRSIRSGVGVDDLGTIAAMHNVTDLFGLSLDASSRGCDTLLVSFVTHSRAFTISNEGELEEVDTLCDLDLSDSTILADSASPDRLVHVSPSLVTLCDTRQDSILATWRPDSSIVAATLMRSTGSSMLLTSIAGAGLVSIRIIDDRLDVTKVTDFGASLQISCIATSPLFPDLAVVGFWQDSSISILNLETHEVVKSIVVDEEEAVAELVVPRSLAIAKMASIGAPTLFVGLANGEVVSYSISRQKPDTIALADRKSTILGNQQAQLKVLREAESQHEQVVALCEHPSLIYGSEGRLVYSAITAEEATCVCTLDNEAFPGAMAMATKDELKLATIDREKTTHVQTLAVGKTVRRLAYSAHFKAFLLGTIKRTLQNQVEQVESHVELVDEVAFKSVAAYALHQDELIGSCIRAELNEGLDEPVQRFVVGTQYIETAEPALHRGRLLIFEVSEDRKLKVVSETKLKGACHCLAMCQGKIVAGLMKSVVIYDLVNERGSLPRLEKLQSYRVATLPVDIAVNADIIAVSDLMKSATLLRLEHDKTEDTWQVVEIARHRETTWATCITPLDDGVWLQADAETNLSILQYDASGYTAEDRHRLRVTSELRLGEMVNRMRPISVNATPGAKVIPRAFCATVEGGIYLVSTIVPEMQDLLMRMQDRMAKLVPSLGDIPFDEYRAFRSRVRTETSPDRFVDGELLEQFLSCGEDLQVEIADGLGDVGSLKDMVEDLKRLH